MKRREEGIFPFCAVINLHIRFFAEGGRKLMRNLLRLQRRAGFKGFWGLSEDGNI